MCKSIAKPNHIFDFEDKSQKLVPILGWENFITAKAKTESFYELNGAIYGGETSLFKKNKRFIDANRAAYVMDKAVSIDIDEAQDLQVAKSIWKLKKSNVTCLYCSLRRHRGPAL